MTDLPPLQQWHNDVTLEFLEHYSKETCIWDPKHPDHKNRTELHKAWLRIQAAMGPEYNVADLKRKKESIMTTFRIHMRRKRRNPDYVPVWFCFQAIESFLGHLYLAEGEEPLNTSEEADNERIKSPYLKHYKRKTRMNPHLKRPNYIEHKTSTPNRLEIKREVQSSPVTYTSNIIEMDECELYGQLLARKLRRLDQHERDMAMHEIDNIMFNAKLNQDKQYESRQAKNRSPVFIETLDKQNEEQYEAEYLEDPMQ